MKHIASSCFGLVAMMASAQTVVSVQNGFWETPSTWDCNCVPGSSHNVVVMHSVEITGDLTVDQAQVQVISTGEITMLFPASIVLSTVFINEGHVLFIGNIVLVNIFNNAGLAEFIGQLTSDGTIINDAGAVIQVEGDFANYFELQGLGSVCVTDTTENFGSISGGLDFCDWTPTTTDPPIIDVNQGTVQNTVTFCTNSACATGVDEVFAADMVLYPSLAADGVEISGVPPSVASVRVLDVHGRVVLSGIKLGGPRLSLDVSMLPPGCYRVLAIGAGGRRALPFVIAR